MNRNKSAERRFGVSITGINGFRGPDGNSSLPSDPAQNSGQNPGTFLGT